MARRNADRLLTGSVRAVSLGVSEDDAGRAFPCFESLASGFRMPGSPMMRVSWCCRGACRGRRPSDGPTVWASRETLGHDPPMSSLRLEDTPDGRRWVLRGAWKRGFAARIERSHDRALYLNWAWGSAAVDLRFLEEVPFLEQLTVLDHGGVVDDSPIAACRALEVLHVGTYASNRLEVAGMPRLRDASFDRYGPVTGVSRCVRLERLYHQRYPGADLAELAGLVRLRDLSIMNSPRLRRLDGLAGLVALRHLRLGLCVNLASLEGVEQRPELQVLRVEACRRIRDVSPVAQLPQLRTLELIDLKDVESLRPLFGLEGLEELRFGGDTRVLDGDLAGLAQLRRLRLVLFANRRHYTHTRDQLSSALAAKSSGAS